MWEVRSYVDDFGDPTSDKYVFAIVEGSFSNSATTNSDLIVKVLIDESMIRFDLYEYARNHPTKGEGDMKFKARSKDSELEFSTYNGDSGVNWVVDTDNPKVRAMLVAGGEI